MADAAPADFDLTTTLRLRAEPEELTAVVLDSAFIHRWCSKVFLTSELLEPGRSDGLGMTLRLQVRGWLPVRFACTARIVDLVRHRSMIVDVAGDFEGRGRLSVEPCGTGECDVTIHWQANVRHGYVRPLLRVFRSVFEHNHDWAMRRAHALMQDEIDRRRRVAVATPATSVGAPAIAPH